MRRSERVEVSPPTSDSHDLQALQEQQQHSGRHHRHSLQHPAFLRPPPPPPSSPQLSSANSLPQQPEQCQYVPLARDKPHELADPPSRASAIPPTHSSPHHVSTQTPFLPRQVQKHSRRPLLCPHLRLEPRQSRRLWFRDETGTSAGGCTDCAGWGHEVGGILE